MILLRTLAITPILLSTGLNITTNTPKKASEINTTISLASDGTNEQNVILPNGTYQYAVTNSTDERSLQTANSTIDYIVASSEYKTENTNNYTEFGTRTISGTNYNINPYQIVFMKIQNTTDTVNSFNWIYTIQPREIWIGGTRQNYQYKKQVYVSQNTTQLELFWQMLQLNIQTIPGTSTYWSYNPWLMRDRLLSNLQNKLQDELLTRLIATNAPTPEESTTTISEYKNETNIVIFYTELISTISQKQNNYNVADTIFGDNTTLKLKTFTDVPQPTNYEVVNVPGLLFQILTMPFTFYSQAFNLTLFPGTPYQFSVTHILLFIVALLIFAYIIRLIMRYK